MMKNNFDRYAPPGINLQYEHQFFAIGIIISLLFSFGFFLRFYHFYLAIHIPLDGEHILRPGAVMENFSVILGNALIGFFILALCMLVLIIYHYAYHRQGSKSIYLMKRLPNRWELHRRCITLPLLSVVICLLIAFVLLLLYYGFYMIFTPKESLTPGQWQRIWSVLS